MNVHIPVSHPTGSHATGSNASALTIQQVKLSDSTASASSTPRISRLFYNSPLGELLIEGTTEAVSTILFTDTTMPEGWPAVHPFPDASASEIHPSDPPESKIPEALRLCRRQLVEYFRGQRREFDFPYTFDGTLFQRAVWSELSGVPYAEFRSYKDLAVAIGSQRAVRAVGAANGRNKLSIVLPCHRIVGASGKLTGYAGGLWRKEWLLQHEAKFGRIGSVRKLS